MRSKIISACASALWHRPSAPIKRSAFASARGGLDLFLRRVDYEEAPTPTAEEVAANADLVSQKEDVPIAWLCSGLTLSTWLLALSSMSWLLAVCVVQYVLIWIFEKGLEMALLMRTDGVQGFVDLCRQFL